MIALSLQPLGDAFGSGGSLYAKAVRIPSGADAIRPRDFFDETFPDVSVALASILERYEERTIAIGLYPPFIRIEEVPIPAKASNRDIRSILQNKSEALGYTRRDDVRFVTSEYEGRHRHFIAAMPADFAVMLRQTARRLKLKLATVQQIPFGWAHAVGDRVSVLLDASNVSRGWYEFSFISPPRAVIGTLPATETAFLDLEVFLSRATQRDFFAEPVTQIAVIDPEGVTSGREVAGLRLEPLRTPLPHQYASYGGLFGLARRKL